MTAKVKICGITTEAAARTAVDGGADFLGFIHFARSPRHLTLEGMAKLMAGIRSAEIDVPLVSVLVDPDDALLSVVADQVRPDLIQLHGRESPARVAEIVAKVNIPVVKAIGVAEAGDLDIAKGYEPHVPFLMFDARAPQNAAMPGGLGLSFDWSLMRGYRGDKPWFLAGGLTPDNVAEALRMSGAQMVDVSSGVESAPGVKDLPLISRFLKAAKSL